MKKIVLAMLALLLAAGAFAQETECISKELDGSLTLRVWGTGRNRTDAIEQARKQAVYDVLFKGVTRGNTDYNMRPIMTEVNVVPRIVSATEILAASVEVVQQVFADMVQVGIHVGSRGGGSRERIAIDG